MYCSLFFLLFQLFTFIIPEIDVHFGWHLVIMCNSGSFIDWRKKNLKILWILKQITNFCIVYNASVYNIRNVCSILLKFVEYMYFDVLCQVKYKKSWKSKNYRFFYCSPFFILLLLFTSIIEAFVVRFWLKFGQYV